MMSGSGGAGVDGGGGGGAGRFVPFFSAGVENIFFVISVNDKES